MNSFPTTRWMNDLLARSLHRPPGGQERDGLLPEARYPSSRERQYRVYVPAGHDPDKPSALLVVLHGCHQTHEDIQRMAGFDSLADQQQFLVLYPYVTSYVGYRARQCWGWWIRSHRTRGRGEVADIVRMVDTVQRDYRIDDSRVFICGLSSGAAMAVNCLVTYADRFAAGASVAGLAFGENAAAVKTSPFAIPRYRSHHRLCHVMARHLAGRDLPPLLIIHSTDDHVVAEYATDALERSWTQLSGCTDAATIGHLEGETRGTPWRWKTQTLDGRQRVARLTVTGHEHGWLGGLEGAYSNPDAPAVSALICGFLKRVGDERSIPSASEPHELMQEAS